MISIGEWPPAYDPYKLDNQLRSIVTRNGGIYLGFLSDFRDIPNSEQYYFPLDGHLTTAGHGLITHLLAKRLTSGAVPALTPQQEPALTG